MSPRPRPTSTLRTFLSLGLALALVACGPNVPKADAYEQTADAMMAAGAFRPAMSQMEKAIKSDPNEPRRWVKLGRAQRAAEQPALAAMSYQRALDLEPANIEALENMAVLLVRAGRYDEAKGYVDPLMALNPDDIAGLLSLGAIEMFKQHFAEANKYADKLIQAAPSSIGGYTLKAHVLSAQGHPTEAADLLAKQVELNPTDQDLALQLLQLYKAGKNVAGVRKASMILAKILPDDPRYQMETVRALHAEGKDDEANAVLDKLQQRFRGNADMMHAIAIYWLGSLPRDQAHAKIVALTAKLGGTAKAELADLLIDEGLADKAVTLLAADAKSEVTSTNTDLHAIYARALLAVHKNKQAKDAAEDVLGFDYTNTVALVVRAQIAYATKHYNDALTDAQIALSTDHQNEDAAILVPQIYMALGNKVLAEQTWGDAQQKLPHSSTINRLRTQWLVAQGRADDAADVAGSYASANAGDIDAWRTFRDLCVAAKSDCVKRANSQLSAMQ